jgi:DNA-3-methyladenine glycosylase II
LALLPIPRPYSFELSTERFRAFGVDPACLWTNATLYRVVRGREVRITEAPGGVEADPLDADTTAEIGHLLGAPFDLDGFYAWAAAPGDTPLAALTSRLAGFRPPLQPNPWETLVTSITAQQVSLFSAFAIRRRFVERLGERHEHAYAFPTRERVAATDETTLTALGFSRAKAAYVLGLARSELDLNQLARLPDDDVRAAVTSQRGLGEWTADWFLARCLGRPTAWPAGDLALRKAVSFFYGDGRDLTTVEVRAMGERFAPYQNLTAHYLLLGRRVP